MSRREEGWALLKQARQGARACREKGLDEERLHDFRVALRRLMVHLKMRRKSHGVPRKRLKRLRKVFRATGPWRDAQVRKAWLEAFSERARKKGLDAGFLLNADRSDGPAPLEDPFWLGAERLLAKIAADLPRAPGQGKPAADWRRAWKKLRRALRAPASGGEPALIHRVRVAAKKLRYALEAMERVPPRAPSLAGLKKLQAGLGDYHDRELIAGRLEGLRALGPVVALALSDLRGEKALLLREARRVMVRLKA